MLLRFFFAVKDPSIDAFDLYNRDQAPWTQDSSLRVPRKARGKSLDG
jgi:hypothetical protein